MGATVNQVLALEEDPGVAPTRALERQVGAFGERGRAAQVVPEVAGELRPELRIIDGVDEGLFQLIERGEQ